MRTSIYFFFTLLGIFSVTAKEYVITDFGATGDGKTLNTNSIQKAIDRCSAEGGGRVVIPNGIFVTGTFF